MKVREVRYANDRDAGFAMFAVLSFLLLSAAVITPFLTGARTKALIARNVAADLKDRLAARGLLILAGQRYVSQTRLGVPVLLRQVVCDTPSGGVRFSFQNHAGLVDLNAASPQLLALGFAALGASPDSALQLADAVVAFRTVATSAALPEPLSVRGGYKHGQFESVGELEDFPAPEGLSLTDARALFTVHSGTGTLHLDEAPAALASAVKAIEPSSAYFVVQGRVPSGALTVKAQLQRRGKMELTADGTVRPADAGSGLVFLTPVELRHETSPIGAGPQDETCETFFGKHGMAAIVALAGEGA
ncbi:MAG: hypothetical protein WCC66_11195 [Rhizobiaceae bacterium]